MKLKKKTGLMILFLFSNLLLMSGNNVFQTKEQVSAKIFHNPFTDDLVLSSNGYSDQITELGEWDYAYGNAQSAWIKDDYLFAASHQNGIIVFDISDPESPVFKKSKKGKKAEGDDFFTQWEKVIKSIKL